MLIKKNKSKKVQNSDSCTVWEYEHRSANMSIATALVNGRYPETGRVVNEECEEVYYVGSGTGIIHSEFGDFELSEGDVYHFAKGEKFWVEGNDLFLIVPCSPKWNKDQHKDVE